MAMNYKFANLLGAPYRGGNLVIQGSELLSAVGNRVSVVSSVSSTSLVNIMCVPVYGGGHWLTAGCRLIWLTT